MSSGPTQEVFELVLARPTATEGGEDAGAVHVWWSAPEQGERVVQVYLDGRLVEVSQDPSVRELWLICDRRRAHRVELVAVDVNDPDGVWKEHPEALRSWEPAVRGEASLAVMRDEGLPVDTHLKVLVDGEVVDRGAMWPASEHRGGFGGIFGVGEFGYDAATGLGLGFGELGIGPLGSDGTAWRWRRGGLPGGAHEVELGAEDTAGRVVAIGATLSGVQTESLPVAAKVLTVAPDFTLSWVV